MDQTGTGWLERGTFGGSTHARGADTLAAKFQNTFQGQAQNVCSRRTGASQLVASVRQVRILQIVPEWQGKVSVGATRKSEARIVLPCSNVTQREPQSDEVVGVKRSHAQIRVPVGFRHSRPFQENTILHKKRGYNEERSARAYAPYSAR